MSTKALVVILLGLILYWVGGGLAAFNAVWANSPGGWFAGMILFFTALLALFGLVVKRR